jgi:hypothetical protein
MPCLTGEQFGLFVTRRTEHIEPEILRDWFPTDDAWVGHVGTGAFPAFDGGTVGRPHSFDRFHMAFPDLSGGRTSINSENCVGTPCDPTEKKVGYGMSRFNYQLVQESFATDLVCWDQALTVDEAKEKYGMFVDGLREISKIVNSNWFKMEAAAGAGTFHLAGVAGDTVTAGFTYTTSGGVPVIKILMGGKLPTSILTLPYLMKFIEPLQLEGYFKQKFDNMPLFKLITDIYTSRSLAVENPTLSALFRFDDFIKGNGQYFKYGASSGVGNFMIAVDHLPLRFNKDAAGDLIRVFPYENVAATVGIKRQVSTQYENADYQLDFIWHPMAMKILTLDAKPLNPQMPFLVRDFAGKWRFAMDNLVINGQAVDNKRRNKGLFYADFKSATKYERPEIMRAIISQRRTNCIVDIASCAAPGVYVAQDPDSTNEACVKSFVFTPTLAAAGGYRIANGAVTCNGVSMIFTAINEATPTALAATLNTELGNLGTWTVTDTTNITLTLSNCGCVEVTFTA